jgi:hypothetical protein
MMQVQLTKPELERFVGDQVNAGHYPSPEAAVEAAIAQMMVDQDEVGPTAEDVKAMSESDSQINRGDSVDFETFASNTKQKFGIR